MLIIFKTTFFLILSFKFSNCDRYYDTRSSEEIVYEQSTTITTTIDDNDTTVSDEITSDDVNNRNTKNTRRRLFDEEDSLTEKRTNYEKKSKTIFEVTTRKWVKEPAESNKTSNNHREELKELCPRFKYSGDFDLNDMADVWQVVYYETKEKVQCFKIQIKKVSAEEKKELNKKYGSFNSKVNWDECNLEIKSSAHIQRTHYLQGNNEDDGVMDNIILLQAPINEKGDSDYMPPLHEEVPDQWMVIRNLLLMRDCETGNIVVFSRVPHPPNLGDILDALREFGEEDKNGKMACVDDEIIKPYDTDDESATNFD